MDRRNFLNALAASCAGGVATLAMPQIAFAQTSGSARFVFVQLRGAMDGLSTFVPYGDPHYAGTRGNLAFNPDSLTRLDGTFGLTPALEPLKAYWDAGQLMPFHAASIPVRSRSHFDAQYILETGLHHGAASQSGWLNRAMTALGGQRTLGVSLGQGIPVSMSGPAQVSSWAPSRFEATDDPLTNALAALYAQDPILGARYGEALNLSALATEVGMADMNDEGGRGATATFNALMGAAGQFWQPTMARALRRWTWAGGIRTVPRARPQACSHASIRSYSAGWRR